MSGDLPVAVAAATPGWRTSDLEQVAVAALARHVYLPRAALTTFRWRVVGAGIVTDANRATDADLRAARDGWLSDYSAVRAPASRHAARTCR